MNYPFFGQSCHWPSTYDKDGPYKSYLMRFHRSEIDLYEDCGETEEAIHPLLFCLAYEDLRNALHAKAIEVGETS